MRAPPPFQYPTYPSKAYGTQSKANGDSGPLPRGRVSGLGKIQQVPCRASLGLGPCPALGPCATGLRLGAGGAALERIIRHTEVL